MIDYSVFPYIAALSSLLAAVILALSLRLRERQIKQILAWVEGRDKAQKELDAARVEMAPCPVCGQRGAYEPENANAVN